MTVGHAWVSGILAYLNDGADGKNKKGYQCLEMKQLAGMYIACFADSALVKSGIIGEATATSVMTGWAGFAGNKGACGIRLKVYDDRTLCFIGAHLAAFQDNVEKRNADYKDIITRAIFPADQRGSSSQNSNVNNAQSQELFYPTVFDCDALFFFGDLNYRIDLPMEDSKALLERKAYKELLEHDQLKKAQKTSLISNLLPTLAHAFEDFQEAEINFQPTYKYDKGTDNFDSSEKERKPAYTDRVLWWTPKSKDEQGDIPLPAVQVACTSYTSAMDVRMSDHKPVLAAFDVTVSTVDKEKRKELVREITANTTQEA